MFLHLRHSIADIIKSLFILCQVGKLDRVYAINVSRTAVILQLGTRWR
jgi:hypothetical protein